MKYFVLHSLFLAAYLCDICAAKYFGFDSLSIGGNLLRAKPRPNTPTHATLSLNTGPSNTVAEGVAGNFAYGVVNEVFQKATDKFTFSPKDKFDIKLGRSILDGSTPLLSGDDQLKLKTGQDQLIKYQHTEYSNVIPNTDPTVMENFLKS